MSMNQLTPADLDAFVSVADTGNFRRSAILLGISQPSITARIQRLEAVLGVSLFHRTTRRVVITDHGERLRQRVLVMVLETRALLREFKDDAHLQRGRVVLGATPSVAASFLPKIISAFQRRWPAIEIILLDDFFGQALDRVSRGEVDLTVIPIEKSNHDLNCEPLLRDVFRLAVSNSHRLAKKSSIKLADMAAEKLISMPSESAAWATMARAFAMQGLHFTPSFKTRDSVTMLSLIKQGLGIGFVPEMLSSVINMNGIALIPIDGVDLGRTIGIVRSKDRRLTNAAEAFCKLLRKSALLHRLSISDQVKDFES